MTEHVPSTLDYGLYGLLGLIVIRELFSLVRWALSTRLNLRRQGSNSGNMTLQQLAAEMRQCFNDQNTLLSKIRDAAVANKIMLEQLLRKG